MDITESRLPQDSVMRVKYGQRTVDFRVSTVPSPRAESVACRLFDPSQRKLDLSNLVVSEAVAELIRRLFYMPQGLILVTGPTGSGKTTTLYAGIQDRQKHNPTNKLVTAEDPIEYELNGATQIQVNPQIGLTFERILRSTLRQDPDIILVGEIRDRPSMEIAIEASLTGHLVLSSLHTNDVFETVIRIRQRGIESYAIASALRGVISQQLVARLCSACSEEMPADPALIEQLRSANILEPNETAKTWQAKGCTHCRMTGQKGRLGLYEVLVMTNELRDAIEKEATLMELRKSAPPGSYISMRRYAKFVMDKGLVNPKDLLEILPATAKADAVN
jgi:type II secretory ATPase GspE/PulE/Tfp pilus assembly ATPase PilB-like protein